MFRSETWVMYVFVYGTLTDSDRVDELITQYTFEGKVVLEGLHRVKGIYPTLAPGGRVAGRLLRNPRDRSARSLRGRRERSLRPRRCSH